MSGITVPVWAKGTEVEWPLSVFSEALMEEVIHKLLLQSLRIKRRQKDGRDSQARVRQTESRSSYIVLDLSAFSSPNPKGKNIYLSVAVVCHL